MDRPGQDSNQNKAGRRAVDRCASDLTRGLPVLIVADASGPALLALAAEHADAAATAELTQISAAPPVLALTANRAAVLNIDVRGAEVALIELGRHLDQNVVRGLADPTADLDHPLRGPFRLSDDAPGALHGAAVALCKLARLLPAALTAPAQTDSGPAAADWAREHDILSVSAAQIAAYERNAALALEKVADARVPLAEAENARVLVYRPATGGAHHLAVAVGAPKPSGPVLVRIHSECLTGDVLGSLRCDCGQQLRGALSEISRAGGGYLLYLAQEGRGIGLVNKLRAYALQDQGFDTVEANLRLGFESDERIFLPAARILEDLGIKQIRLMTNNPDKMEGLRNCGVEVTERVPHAFPANDHNAFYLSTKAKKSGHLL